jgi:hypothetical protein
MLDQGFLRASQSAHLAIGFGLSRQSLVRFRSCNRYRVPMASLCIPALARVSAVIIGTSSHWVRLVFCTYENLLAVIIPTDCRWGRFVTSVCDISTRFSHGPQTRPNGENSLPRLAHEGVKEIRRFGTPTVLPTLPQKGAMSSFALSICQAPSERQEYEWVGCLRKFYCSEHPDTAKI